MYHYSELSLHVLHVKSSDGILFLINIYYECGPQDQWELSIIADTYGHALVYTVLAVTMIMAVSGNKVKV